MSPLPAPRAVAELVRAPAALTVPGDSLVGAAAAGWPFGPATPALALSSVLLYWAGMALNDYADRGVDAMERPERPIPSGRVQPGFALGLSVGLTAAAVGIAGFAGGRRATAVAVPLAATVWAYDLALKPTAAGPAAMAAARALDVLLGAGRGRLRAAVAPATMVAAHTLAVTVLSRREVTGADPLIPTVTLAATGAVGVAVAAWPRAAGPRTRRERSAVTGALRWIAGSGPLGAYLVTAGRAQYAAAVYPSAGRVRRAVGAGILGLMPLQAALAVRATGRPRPGEPGGRIGGPPVRSRTAAAGSLVVAGVLSAAFPLARRLSRKVSAT
ncbi:MAG: SCO3242 family prenyltransferase [Actinoallomurus sp.]